MGIIQYIYDIFGWSSKTSINSIAVADEENQISGESSNGVRSHSPIRQHQGTKTELKYSDKSIGVQSDLTKLTCNQEAIIRNVEVQSDLTTSNIIPIIEYDNLKINMLKILHILEITLSQDPDLSKQLKELSCITRIRQEDHNVDAPNGLNKNIRNSFSPDETRFVEEIETLLKTRASEKEKLKHVIRKGLEKVRKINLQCDENYDDIFKEEEELYYRERMKEMDGIKSEVNNVQKFAERFEGNETNADFLHVQEMLGRCIHQLDNMKNLRDREHLKSERKAIVKLIQQVDSLLQSKLVT